MFGMDMDAPRGTKGFGARRRKHLQRGELSRLRKSVRLELRMDVYAKLLRLADARHEPMVSVVERLINEAEM